MGSTRMFPKTFKSQRAKLFLMLFLVCELLCIAVEGKSTSTMNTFKNVTIVSKSGKYLTIGQQGITGENSDGPYAKLQIHTVGFKGKITIKGIKVGKYLAMDTNGKVSLVTSETKDAVFIDRRKIGKPFVSIRSKLYPSKYLSISTLGYVSGSTTKGTDNTKYTFFLS